MSVNESEEHSSKLKVERDDATAILEKTKKVGRKRGPIWNYFELTDDRKASCKQLNSSIGQPCKASYAAACPSSMEYHLERMHNSEYAEYLSAKMAYEKVLKLKKQKMQDVDENTSPLADSSQKLTENDPLCKRFHDKLALALVCSGASINFVNCPEFREFIHELNNGYPLPHRKKITNLVDGLFDRTLANCKEAVGQARKIAICVDLWSRKNMKTTFVGVSAHFFSPRDHRRCSAKN